MKLQYKKLKFSFLYLVSPLCGWNDQNWVILKCKNQFVNIEKLELQLSLFIRRGCNRCSNYDMLTGPSKIELILLMYNLNRLIKING
jgi:hypothetical protein